MSTNRRTAAPRVSDVSTRQPAQPAAGNTMSVMAPPPSVDALLPADMAAKAEAIGVRKAAMPAADLFALALLAGAFVALGALFATVVGSGFAGSGFPGGIQRMLMGVAFCLGLVLVVVGGAELFTGNNLIVMAWAGRRVSTGLMMRNWAIVYLGNLVGALGTAALVFVARQYTFLGGQTGQMALGIAESKGSLLFFQAVALGILCNGLVCLAVWLTYSARSTADKILAIVFPITAFVAAGLEHSVANMYFMPYGMMIKAWAPASFWESIGKTAADYPHITWQGFLLDNLLPVTIGNIIGGAVLVGAVYWWVYLRQKSSTSHAGKA
ncbi:MAG: formate/nitrite transporter family protein [Caldilineaceae bacterium]